jgi:hypothetical protein
VHWIQFARHFIIFSTKIRFSVALISLVEKRRQINPRQGAQCTYFSRMVRTRVAQLEHSLAAGGDKVDRDMEDYGDDVENICKDKD